VGNDGVMSTAHGWRLERSSTHTSSQPTPLFLTHLLIHPPYLSLIVATEVVRDRIKRMEKDSLF
jgi:hypothetical protein